MYVNKAFIILYYHWNKNKVKQIVLDTELNILYNFEYIIFIFYMFTLSSIIQCSQWINATCINFTVKISSYKE